MRFKLFAFIWFAALAAAPLALSADSTFDHSSAGCCDKPAMACCDKPEKACCDKPAATEAQGCCQTGAAHNHGAKGCCADGACEMPCCNGGACDMPCCRDKAATHGAVDLDGVEILFAMSGERIIPTSVTTTPTKQFAVVVFQRPVWVGNTVLMGKHVIEHDTLRQARGEPCTHIYAATNMKTPVATFHCTHVDVPATDRDVVVLQSIGDGSKRFLQFQFKGETAAHGFPTER
jgi:hypothetical protein